MSVQATAIPGLLVIRLKQSSDLRGVGYEFYRESATAETRPAEGWKQVNVVVTVRGAIRGLHAEATTKLVSVVAGEAFGAYVDTRPAAAGAPRVVTVPLTAGTQVLVPPDVCSGFQAVSQAPAVYLYCLDREWTPRGRTAGLHPLDPALGISWPVAIDPSDRAMLSAADSALPMRR